MFPIWEGVEQMELNTSGFLKYRENRISFFRTATVELKGSKYRIDRRSDYRIAPAKVENSEGMVRVLFVNDDTNEPILIIPRPFPCTVLVDAVRHIGTQIPEEGGDDKHCWTNTHHLRRASFWVELPKSDFHESHVQDCLSEIVRAIQLLPTMCVA